MALSKSGLLRITKNNLPLVLFVALHLSFSTFLGRLFALAPDEGGYLWTFNNIYTWPGSTVAQSGSGWISAPTTFLWVAYAPAKLLNLLGLSDILSIRFLAIGMSAASFYLLMNLAKKSNVASRYSRLTLIGAFFIPSIFLWTSVGLRESFILFSITLFLTGFFQLQAGKGWVAWLSIIIGSYTLISTKNYLWILLVASLLVLYVLSIKIRGLRKNGWKLLVAGFLLPSLLFGLTTSAYALQFTFESIFNINITSTGERSGDSITQVLVEIPTGTGTGTGTGTKQLLTFHGDSTLISLHFYLLNNPDAPFSKIMRFIGWDKKIDKIWQSKVEAGLVELARLNKPTKPESGLYAHILKPGKISNPITMIKPSLLFLFGPFPFQSGRGVSLDIISLESPLWWLLYAGVIYQCTRIRTRKFFHDPVFVFSTIFFFALVAFSSLVAVNLGTSFRHRSIILIPLIMIYIQARIYSKPAIQDDKISKP